MKGIQVLFENDEFLVLNKPAGLSVQGGKDAGRALDSLLAETYTPRPLLVHRLDRDTSGVIVTAKNKKSAAACAALFGRAGGIHKRYLALCAGLVEKGGVIRESLEKRGREQRAETAYRPLGAAVLPDGAPGGEADGAHGVAHDGTDRFCSLLELEPATGRMHQIRRHLAGLGHPVLGDDKYGDFALNRRIKKSLGSKRLLLHAALLRLPPALVPGGPEIRAPLPDYFAALLERLGLEYGHNA